MFAVAHSDVIEFVTYVGVHDEYPEWFMESMIQDMDFTPSGRPAIYYSEVDCVEFYEGDVFLVNELNQLYRIDNQKFADEFYEVDGLISRRSASHTWQSLAAAKDDCLESVAWCGLDGNYPTWFNDLIEDGRVFIQSGCGVYYDDEHGEYALAIGDMFLCNFQGLVKLLTRPEFEEHFYDVY